MDLTAVGTEVVGVVVGILIALWVNDWNQRRLDRRKAAIYIASLRADVGSDVDALRQRADFAEGTSDAARALIAVIRGEAPLPEANTTLRLLKRAGTVYPFRPTTTTYQELAGGGNLSIVEDRALLRSIVQYYAATELAQEGAGLAIRRIWLEYYDVLARSIDPTLIPRMTLDVFHLMREGGAYTPAEAGSDRALPSLGLSDGSFDPGVLRGAGDLERALAMVLDTAVFVRESLNDLGGAASGLCDELDRKLGGRA